MPTVNTLVVERSDCSASAEHQLRGVSAAAAHARTRNCSTAGRAATEEAYERLRTIGEATDLGRGSRSRCATSSPRRRQLLGESRADTSPRSATTSTARCDGGVGEMKGERSSRPPAEIKLDVPRTRSCPRTTSPRKSCGSRRTALAGVTTASEVTRACEWEDRSGRFPSRRGAARRGLPSRRGAPARPARHLDHGLAGASRPAKLKAASRCGSGASPAKRSTRRTDQLVVPIERGKTPAEFLVAFLRELVPE